MGKEFFLAADHKASTSALGKIDRTKFINLDSLGTWLDFYLQFKVIHIHGNDMSIVDYLSSEPNGDPWPESELDE